MTYHKAGS